VNVKQVDRYIIDNDKTLFLEDVPNRSRASIPQSLTNIEILLGNQLSMQQDSIEVSSENNSVAKSPLISVRSKQVKAYQIFSVSSLKLHAHQLIQFIFEAETERLIKALTLSAQSEKTNRKLPEP